MTARLQLAITIAEQRDNKGELTRPASAYASQLAWDDHTVSYDDAAGRRVVLDFAARQQREIDERARTVTITPLQALVSARAAEVRNCGEHIYEVLKAGGLPDNDFAPILAEHFLAAGLPGKRRTLGKRSLLSRLTGGPDLALVERDAGTDVMFRARCLASIARAGLGPPDGLAAFTHFLRRVFGGHPCILQRIREGNQLPASVTLAHLAPMHAGGEVTVRVVEPVAPTPAPAIDGFEERLPVDGSDDIDAVLQDRHAPSPARSITTRCAEALALFEGPTPLLGLLTFLELTLEQRVATPPDIAAAMRSSTDEDVTRLIALLRASDEVDPHDRLAVFDALRGPAGHLAYLLGTFEVPVRRRLNQPAEARAGLTAALVANPRLTGAWKDLGDLFCRVPDFTRAWLCWERARALAPTHPLLDDIAAHERQLEANYPEYLRAT